MAGLLIHFFEMYKDLVNYFKGAQKKLLEALWSIYCWFIGSINFKVYYQLKYIKKIQFSHLNKICLT